MTDEVKDGGAAFPLTIERGDRFLGSVLAGSTEWLTCEKITSVMNGPWWAAGVDEHGVNGGCYVHELTFVWKAGEDVPRNTINGELMRGFMHPADALLSARKED